MADRLWSRKFVAERWGKSEKTVQRTGMVFTRIGKTPMYHPKIVLRYEEDHSSRIAAWKEGVAA